MIYCCGEALIDMIPTDAIDGTSAFAPHAGGAVFNTAITLGRLGIKTGLLTGLSNDMFGRILQSELEKCAVDTRMVIRSDRPTTLAFVEMTGGQARYDFFDENSAGRMLSSKEMPELPAKARALFFGGISLAVEPAADAYASLLLEQGRDRLVMLDPNIRPGFIDDPEQYRARLDSMISRADILKVSDEDLVWLVPGGELLSDRAHTLMAGGPSVVIVTQGGAGATAFRQNGTEINVPARAVEVVDTVGAGDSFNGGFLAKLSELGAMAKHAIGDLPDAVLHAALTHGAEVAAVTVSRQGANPPWANEIRALAQP